MLCSCVTSQALQPAPQEATPRGPVMLKPTAHAFMEEGATCRLAGQAKPVWRACGAHAERSVLHGGRDGRASLWGGRACGAHTHETVPPCRRLLLRTRPRRSRRSPSVCSGASRAQHSKPQLHSQLGPASSRAQLQPCSWWCSWWRWQAMLCSCWGRPELPLLCSVRGSWQPPWFSSCRALRQRQLPPTKVCQLVPTCLL